MLSKFFQISHRSLSLSGGYHFLRGFFISQMAIRIKDLPLVTSPESFFSIDKIMSVDVLDINDAPIELKLNLQKEFGTFVYKGRMYYPLILKGSPENLILRLTKGFPLPWGAILFFDGDLLSLLNQKKIYDISNIYTSGKMELSREDNAFLTERYILPYLK